MSKKSVLITITAVLFVSMFFTACASTKAKSDGERQTSETTAASQTEESSEFLYIPDSDEMSSFFSNMAYLKKCDSGEVTVDEALVKTFFSVVGRNDLISLQMENFLRDVKNKDVQKKVSDYIKKNKIDTPYTQALLKKYSSTEKKFDDNGHEVIQYSYKEEEFDEDIILYNFNEIHPFNDEFGLLLFANDWNVLTLNNNDGTPSDEKTIYVIHGGGTNCLTVSFKEIENVNSKEDFAKIINPFIESKNQGDQADEWSFYQLNKTGVLENCGVDEYIIYSRIGPDIIPEISAGSFGAFLYSEKYGKVYRIDFFLNYSKININYDIRDRIFPYVRFFALFGYCD